MSWGEHRSPRLQAKFFDPTLENTNPAYRLTEILAQNLTNVAISLRNL